MLIVQLYQTKGVQVGLWVAVASDKCVYQGQVYTQLKPYRDNQCYSFLQPVGVALFGNHVKATTVI